MTFQRRAETLRVAGVGDYWPEEQNLRRALEGSRPHMAARMAALRIFGPWGDTA